MKKLFISILSIFLCSCALVSCKPYTGETPTGSQAVTEHSTELPPASIETDQPSETESEKKENDTAHDENEGEWDVE